MCVCVSSPGAAYIFTRSTGTGTGTPRWSQAQKLLAFDGQPQDSFGWSVDMFGSRAVVGAYGDSTDLTSFSGMTGLVRGG